jgi:hypothetical protein
MSYSGYCDNLNHRSSPDLFMGPLLKSSQPNMSIMETDFLNLTGFQWQCLTAILIALSIRFIIGRRRFNRRSVSGQQQYSGYSKGLVVSFIEKLLMIVSGILLIVGFILFLVGY